MPGNPLENSQAPTAASWNYDVVFEDSEGEVWSPGVCPGVDGLNKNDYIILDGTDYKVKEKRLEITTDAGWPSESCLHIVLQAV